MDDPTTLIALIEIFIAASILIAIGRAWRATRNNWEHDKDDLP